MNKLEKILEAGGVKKDIICLIISAAALIISLFDINLFSFNIAWVAIILCGVPIILEALIGLIRDFDIKADVLVAIALVASVITSEYFAAGEVAVIMQLGSLLEELTVSKARAGIEKLIDMTPGTARILINGEEKIILSEEVAVNDIIKILPGETIAADGIIISGQTSVDQSVMTGESVPVDKFPGDEVKSGTVNQFGTIEIRAIKAGKDSSFQRMVKLVQSRDAGKAKIVSIADRWATWIVAVALLSSVITGLITGEIIRSVTILVVFCPCALVLATPTAIMAAIGNVTKYGILVREGDALENLSKVDKITFDKTGTLTNGKPEVIDVKSFLPQYTEDEIYEIAASAESASEHPLGKAITESYRKNKSSNIARPENFKMVLGRGISALVNGREVIAGNGEFMKEYNITGFNEAELNKYISEGCTIIFISIDKSPAGAIILSDTVRNSADTIIEKIKSFNITPTLLTGDCKNAAGYIADVVGIKEIKSDCLPEDKLDYINNEENNGSKVCMIGDGINDAPALKKATVGISMGGIGSDIAVDASDITLVHDDISVMPHLISISKKMMNTIKLNMIFSLSLNFIAIILAATGVLNPIVGALVHNAGSVAVIINSSLLLKWSEN